MKKLTLGLIALLIMFPALSFAQSSNSSTTMPKPPASWIAFQQQENAKRQAFFKQMKEDRDSFLATNPDAKAYIEQMRAFSQTRMAAWRAAHPRNTTNGFGGLNGNTAH